MDPRVERFKEWMTSVRRLQGGTVYAYGETLRYFAEWIDMSDLEAITSQDIEAFMSRERARVKIGMPSTQDRDRVALMAFWKWAVAHGEAVGNPTLDVAVPKVRSRKPKAVDDDLWARLWGAEMPVEDRAWLGLMCFAGLRRREVVSLTPPQVDAKRGLLMYLSRKGGNEDVVEYAEMVRIVASGLPKVCPEPRAFLDEVALHAERREGEHRFLTMDKPASQTMRDRASFGHDPWMPDPHVINYRLMKLLGMAGLPRTQFSPHALRHTCVTNLLRCGVPIEVVSDAVGHSNIDTTRRYVKTAGRLVEWRQRLEKR